MKIAAAVVTYNRKELLIKCIEKIRNQTFKLDSILVVNNSSSDGTLEWLNLQTDLFVITQENLGSAGGQFAAVNFYSQKDINWLWLMDDDIAPEDDCLEELVNVCLSNPYASAVVPVRYENGDLLTYEAKDINLTKFYRGFNRKFISSSDLIHKYFEIKTFPFEGPLINIQAINNIGLPDAKFFIIADDTDYAIRLSEYGKILMVSNAKMNKLIVSNQMVFNWKLYYQLRNLIYLDRTYGKNGFVRIFRPLITSLLYSTFLFKDFNILKFKYFLKSILDGYRDVRGRTVLPGEF